MFKASSSRLRFAPLPSPTSQTSGVTSSVPASISAAKLFANPALLLTATPIQKPVVLQPQKSAESSKASKFSPEFAKYMIGLTKDRTAYSTMIAELEETIRSGTVTSDGRLPTKTATSPAPSGAISSVNIATSSGASSNAAGAMSPAVSGAASNVPLKWPASPQPAVLILPVVVTACRYAALRCRYVARCCHYTALQSRNTVCRYAARRCATPYAAAVASHLTVVSQPAAVPRPAAGAQPASTFQRASTTLPTGK